MRYRLTTRGRIVAVVFVILLIAVGVSLYNPEENIGDSKISETTDKELSNNSTPEEYAENNETEMDKDRLEEELPNTTGNDSNETIVSAEESAMIEEKIKTLEHAAERVYFKPDKFNLIDNELAKMNEFIEIALEFPENTIIIEGNINGYPQYDDTDFGMTLSNKRAEVIMNYLIEKGIKKDQIYILGMGSKKPIENSSSINDCWKNRTADIYFKDHNRLEYQYIGAHII